jgi:uncharacterized protein YdhG (YjbR/CyaY superfamily)
MNTLNDIDKYIACFPTEIQEKLQQLRDIIQKAAPDSQEVISYKMPAYKMKGILVYFAGYKNHIGFYPTESPIRVFGDELIDYKTSKGAIQFPVGRPLPANLITRIVKYRINEDSVHLKRKIK